MKKLRKIVSLLLAVVMMMSLCVVVTADDTATLTIKDTTSGASYEVYKILDVTVGTDSQNNPTYAYTVPTDWLDFFWDSTEEETASDVKDYVTVTKVNDTYYVTWNDTASTSTANMQAFAVLIADYISSESIQATATETGNGSDLEISNLPLGYYYVKSGVGTLVDLDTVGANTTVVDKNAKPTIDKYVSDEDDNYAGTSTTDFTETVYYEVKITGVDEITTLVLHDLLPTGFTLNSDSVKVYIYGSDDAQKAELSTSEYELDTAPSSCGTYTNCSFEINFSNLLAETATGTNYVEYILGDSTPANAYLVVKYTASVSTTATVGSNGNINKATITTNATEDKEATTTTYIYDFYVYKYDSDESTALSGAEFVLKNSAGKYAIFTYNDTDKYYYLTGWGDTEGTTKLTSGTDGLIHIKGLDASTNYYLTETAAPDGYAISTETVTVNIGTDGTITGADTTIVSGSQTIKFANSTSSEMPSTGGIGVTIFYVLGGVIVVAAVVLIVVLKKRTAKVSK